jgi:AraC-like DNA-binding protein
MRKLICRVSFDKTCECLWFFRKEWYQGWKGFRTVFINIPKNVKTFKQLKKWLAQDFPAQELNLVSKKLQTKWDNINDEFFKIIKEITESDWKYKSYFCYVQHAVVGNYHPLNGNEIFVSTKDSRLKDKLQEIAEELIHQHYWDIWRKTFINIRFPWRNLKRWILSEIIAELILSETELQQLFGEVREKFYFLPQEKIIQIKQLWMERKSFKDFLIKAHSLNLKNEVYILNRRQ